VENSDEVVVDSCFLSTAKDVLESLWVGQTSSYAGPYAIAQKAQSAASTGHSLAFFRVSALRQIGVWPSAMYLFSSETIVQWCELLVEKGWGVAFSPLVRARVGSTFRGKSTRIKITPKVKYLADSSLSRYRSKLDFKI
jgi:hypothetical protein